MTESQLTDLALRVAYLETVLMRIATMTERDNPQLMAWCAMDYYRHSLIAPRD